MSWRTIVLTKDCKVSLRLRHLVVKNEEIVSIPLTEIGQLIIENPNIVLTGHIINALAEYKIVTIVCDTGHMPMTNINLIYGHFRQERVIKAQLSWPHSRQDYLWQQIVKNKIANQKYVLERFYPNTSSEKFNKYIADVELNDDTNREGHAAKVYFNILFGKNFVRGQDTPINWGLNYGYSLLLSLFTRAIITKGLLTEMGIHHYNQYNHYNLASDFMEVYRPIVDIRVKQYITDIFDRKLKQKMINIFNHKVEIKGRMQYLSNSVELYIDSLTKFLESGNNKDLHFPVIEK